jgi:hypothetical protein
MDLHQANLFSDRIQDEPRNYRFLVYKKITPGWEKSPAKSK